MTYQAGVPPGLGSPPRPGSRRFFHSRISAPRAAGSPIRSRVPGDSRRHVLVICPLAHEARAIRRAVRQVPSVQVVVSGPGPGAVHRALDRAMNPPSQGLGILLAGVAGELATVPASFFIQTVVDAGGARYQPSFPAPSDASGDGVTLLGLDAPAATPAEKLAWHERSGARLVDTESHVLARLCSERGIPWGVVRGISDAAHETLPAQALDWVTPAGRTRILRPLADILRTPALIPAVVRLGRRSARSLPDVGARVAVLARTWTMQ